MEEKKKLIETKEEKVKEEKEIYEAPDFYEHKPLESVSAGVYYYYFW